MSSFFVPFLNAQTVCDKLLPYLQYLGSAVCLAPICSPRQMSLFNLAGMFATLNWEQNQRKYFPFLLQSKISSLNVFQESFGKESISLKSYLFVIKSKQAEKSFKSGEGGILAKLENLI